MNKTKYILNIAWDGKLGDAILSSHFIQHISQILYTAL
ncbi:Uncharacterised protein [Eikenella corrodens]|uniref:Uncharacterized protein n=1 Tax=Eikenella corrodens TaxID=539 RepID=A0A8B4GR35_EIKCO|nr:Uncharacterised protein [Eikenella corrodens]